MPLEMIVSRCRSYCCTVLASSHVGGNPGQPRNMRAKPATEQLGYFQTQPATPTHMKSCHCIRARAV
eukprot:6210115-Pleurochrysis_carterae.AAC.4